MKNTNIHPIYFRSFVGIWKRTLKDGSPTNSDFLLKFNENLTFEELLNIRGTVNGDVDEVSVEGDENYPDKTAIPGSITLIKDGQEQIWSFVLKASDSIGQNSNKRTSMNILELNCPETREEYQLQHGVKIRPGGFRKGKTLKS